MLLANVICFATAHAICAPKLGEPGEASAALSFRALVPNTLFPGSLWPATISTLTSRNAACFPGHRHGVDGQPQGSDA
jgi:hypothetical protein